MIAKSNVLINNGKFPIFFCYVFLLTRVYIFFFDNDSGLATAEPESRDVITFSQSEEN